MNKNIFLISKFILTYIVLMLIILNIHYLIPVNFFILERIPFSYVPIAYLIVKNIFYKELDKLGKGREEYLLSVVIGFTVVNLILKLPLKYDICIAVFLFILNTKHNNIKKETERYIAEYFEKQSSNKK